MVAFGLASLYSAVAAPAFRDANWISIGGLPGVNGPVFAAVVDGSGNLYIGGRFTVVGDVVATNIAKWNGSSWMALGSGMGGNVSALAVSGSDVYAGGNFTTAGGSAANYIAKWNGSSWSALGSGMNDWVFALAVSGSDLYAGGLFTTAGGMVSAHVARAYLERPTLSILRSGGDVTLSWPLFYGGFVLQQNPDVANSNSWSNANCPLTTNGAIKSAIIPLTLGNQFFRLIEN